MENINITGATKLTGLLGSPVAHSKSPAMHNEAFRLLGLDYVYLCFDVDENNMESAVEGLRTLGVAGFNCTMPDKIKMWELCDELSLAANLIGAVNTVVNVDGKFVGHNTDGTGYMQSVKDAGFDIIGGKMTLMGAGGAASSILVQAAIDGVKEIDVYNRPGVNFDKAQILIDKLNEVTSSKISLYDLNDETSLKKSLDSSTILTNGTSLGMAPNNDSCIIKNSSFLHPELIVSDIVYNPLETKLMKMSKEIGCPVFNGLYMLLYQGAEAFKLWTGEEMPVNEIKSKFF
ncbi:MAG: shikimate dehydrogenase [Eubacterium sp.]|uniref:shikimate dehydrogenase n=1 Tax=Eubacterium sp. TaxID=142586 RepID=UPI00300F42B2